jgi:hypothetical protein
LTEIVKPMFSRSLLAVAAASLAAAGLANADSITAVLSAPTAPTGTSPTVVSLSGITAPSQTTLTGSGYTVSFSTTSDQGLVQGSIYGRHAVPVGGVTSGGTPEYLTGDFGSTLTTDITKSGNYFSTGSQSITFTFSTPETSLALLWGSIDDGNSLVFSNGLIVTGTEVQDAAKGFVSNGYQGPGGSAYVVIDTTVPFTSFTAASSVVSFEFGAVAASTVPFDTAPEPISLLLTTAGIGLIGLLILRRRRPDKAPTDNAQ